MAKPSAQPRWADVGGAISDPPSNKKDVGWAAGERPKAQFLNWWQNVVYQWTTYLSNLENEALTWVAKQVMQRLEVQAPFLATPALIARIKADHGTAARFLVDAFGFPMGRFFQRDFHWEFGGPAGTVDVTASGDPMSVSSIAVPWRLSMTGTGGRLRFYRAGELPTALQSLGTPAINFNVPVGGRITLSHRAFEFAAVHLDGNQFVMEFEVAFTTSLANANVRIGFLERSVLPGASISNWDNTGHFALRKNSGDTNWRLVHQRSGPVVDNVDLGIAVALNQWYTVKLVMKPPTGYEVYIDGALRSSATLAIRVPDSATGFDLVFPVITVEETGGASSAQLFVGPIRVRHPMLTTSYEI